MIYLVRSRRACLRLFALLCAAEGLNGTLSGAHGNIAAFVNTMVVDFGFVAADFKHSTGGTEPFPDLAGKVVN